jgi:4-amino-4-deoxychorismate lyase
METFFETLALRDGLPLHLDYHTARLNRTCREVFGTTRPIDIAAYLSHHSFVEIQRTPPAHLSTHSSPQTFQKLRLVYNGIGILSHELTPYTPKTIHAIHMIEADIHYPHKSTDRSRLDNLSGTCNETEDILVTHDGYLRDTTIANIALKQNGIWFTPDIPLLPGTTRARLIDEGKLIPRPIHRNDLTTYNGFAIMNALIGFVELPLSILHFKQ